MDSYALSGEVLSVWVTNHYAFAARGYSGRIAILDVANPSQPTLLIDYQPPGGVTEIVDAMVQGYTCYSSHLTDGVYFTDVSVPSSPAPLGRKNTVGETVNLAPRYPYLYVADEWEGLVVISLTSLDSAWHVVTTGWAKNVVLRNDTAFVCQWDAGLALVDISSPTNPQILAEYNTPGLAHHCASKADHIYVADDNAGLSILSLDGALVGGYDTGGSTWDVWVSGDYAYLADAQGGLLVLDISDPISPRLVGSYQTPGVAQRVFLDGTSIYVADQYSLGIYRFTGVGVNDPPVISLPAEFALTAYPNPFNSSAVLSVQVPFWQKVDLSIYNVLGQRLGSIYQGDLGPGIHHLSWDAAGLASGAYLVRLGTADAVACQKMILLK